MQCYRCQYWRHSSPTFRLNPRCCKCDSNHDTPNCDNRKREDPKNCNCAKNHAASYSGCPKFSKINRPTFNSTPYNPNNSFTNVLKPKIAPTQSPIQGTHPQQVIDNKFTLSDLKNVLNEIAKEFTVQNFQQLINKYQNILQQIRSAPNVAVIHSYDSFWTTTTSDPIMGIKWF